MIEGRPRDSLVLYETPIEVRNHPYATPFSFLFWIIWHIFSFLSTQTTSGVDPNDVFKKTFGCKFFPLLNSLWLFWPQKNKLKYAAKKTINETKQTYLTCADSYFLFIASKRAGTLPPMESKPKQEDILNAILPPRSWVENGKLLFVHFLMNYYVTANIFVRLFEFYRKALHSICESLAGVENWRCKTAWDARLETYGAPG